MGFARGISFGKSGTLSDGKIAIMMGLEEWVNWITLDQLKAFCAAFGTTGSAPLIHIAGVTPEAKDSQVVKRWIDLLPRAVC